MAGLAMDRNQGEEVISHAAIIGGALVDAASNGLPDVLESTELLGVFQYPDCESLGEVEQFYDPCGSAHVAHSR